MSVRNGCLDFRLARSPSTSVFGIGLIEDDLLDAAARAGDQLALAALHQPVQHLGFDLQVPGVVVLAGLEHRARRGRWRRRRP